MSYRVLALSHIDEEITIYEDYCNGLKDNSSFFHQIDYVELYLKNGKANFEQYIFNFVLSERIEYVFIIILSGDLTFDLSFLNKLSKVVNVVFNFFDTENYFDSVDKYYAQVACLIILPNYLPKFSYELLGISALCTFPLYDANKYVFDKSMQKSINVSFVGNVIKTNRSKYTDYLASRGITVDQYGRNTANGFITHDQMVSVFNSSKININFSAATQNNCMILGENINNRKMQLKGRITEIALCGGFVLTEYAPSIDKMYEIGSEIEVFINEQDLYSKIVYYLENHEKRQNIAINGYKRALADYDSKTKFNKVFDNLHTYKRQNDEIYTDKTFLQNYASYRILYLTINLFKGRIWNSIEEIVAIFKVRRLSISHAFSYFLKALNLSFSLRIKQQIKRIIKVPTKY